jgi:enoyl-[acyl-carrier-protein] reductase (NADH)
MLQHSSCLIWLAEITGEITYVDAGFSRVVGGMDEV